VFWNAIGKAKASFIEMYTCSIQVRCGITQWSLSDPRNREWYVQLPEGSIPPGAIAARELLAEGASVSVWTDCWGGRAVFMSPELVCVELAGELRDILQTIRAANGNKWFGLPDVIGIFPDGRVVMREMKLAGKDKLRDTQHAFARLARRLFPDRIRFEVIEWVGRSTKMRPNQSRGCVISQN
jgi:hypothetical protein